MIGTDWFAWASIESTWLGPATTPERWGLWRMFAVTGDG